MAALKIDGPYFEDFSIGDEFSAPAITLTDGHAALYQALMADRMRLPLDRELSRQVTGRSEPIAHPHLVLNMVNGQTTHATQHVKGNLFYRGLIFRAPIFIGDTLSTSTRVVGLKQNRPKPGRAATGMVALEMDTRNQHGDSVLRYWRCPMIPCRNPEAETGHDSDLSSIAGDVGENDRIAAVPNSWNLEPFASNVTGLKALTYAVGDEVDIVPRDTITCAPELVRLTLNIAYTHTDATKSYLDKRLVYGGHTISMALAQISRALPSIITVIAWSSCDHTAPVAEEDLIRTRFSVLDKHQCKAGGDLLDLHIESFGGRMEPDSDELKETKVLDWKVTVWCA